jgi:hypothetical protein
VPEEATDVWREVLREAIAANPAPVVGTHFRDVVNLAAAKRELRFPPSDEQQLRFIQLLERYPDIVAVLRRPGQDFLVAPADKADLLTKRVQERLFGIRNDFFQALTTISQNRPYYDKTSDRVVWQEAGDTQTISDSLVPIEPTTLATEVKLRREFAEQMLEPAKSALLRTLEEPSPLQAFGKKVRDTGLQIQWHSFRTKRVLERMQHWASDKKVEWKDVWLTRERPSYRRQEPNVSADARNSREGVTSTERDPLHVLFSSLDAADMQRISIPLDLVLKVLGSRKP